jgi:hypothetical protein
VIVAHHGGELSAFAGLAATAAVVLPPLVWAARARINAVTARVRGRRR